MSSQLLIVAVLVVGVLHTLVPDHWVPITLLARQRGWSTREVARTAALAGLGHAVSTLFLGVILWFVGVAFAARFGRGIDLLTSLALVAFGTWVAVGAWREARAQSRGGFPELAHAHIHRHEGGPTHVHWHVHTEQDWHTDLGYTQQSAPIHEHDHPKSGRTSLLLVLGSSPMIEGIPAFFAAARFGPPVIIIMSIVFALSTIVTYVALCVASTAGLQQTHLGPLERYGEVISGSFIALLGFVFLFIR